MRPTGRLLVSTPLQQVAHEDQERHDPYEPQPGNEMNLENTMGVQPLLVVVESNEEIFHEACVAA
jgi:hypothetical protein